MHIKMGLSFNCHDGTIHNHHHCKCKISTQTLRVVILRFFFGFVFNCFIVLLCLFLDNCSWSMFKFLLHCVLHSQFCEQSNGVYWWNGKSLNFDLEVCLYCVWRWMIPPPHQIQICCRVYLPGVKPGKCFRYIFCCACDLATYSLLHLVNDFHTVSEK